MDQFRQGRLNAASRCISVKENNAQYVNGTIMDCKTRKPLANVLLTVTDLRHPGPDTG